MKVFVFDLLAYGEQLDHLKAGGTELPYPLPKQHFKAGVAAGATGGFRGRQAQVQEIGLEAVAVDVVGFARDDVE